VVELSNLTQVSAMKVLNSLAAQRALNPTPCMAATNDFAETGTRGIGVNGRKLALAFSQMAM